GEVTRAVRTTIMDGRQVREGEAIALLDGRLVASCDSLSQAVLELCRSASPDAGALITLYWGEDTGPDEAETVADMVRACYPDVEVESVQGGQPHYDYLVSIE
ncbi:MAG: DAK2 domain-containing protein, partial [Chloroflexi bacterium]|nr:DAK2 domain-containing protein [Chloroflexota bacterium]